MHRTESEKLKALINEKYLNWSVVELKDELCKRGESLKGI